MMKQDYIELGPRADPNGNRIVVVEPTSDGRYEVEHPPLKGRMVMGAKTIRSLYPIVGAILALALLPAVAFASAKHLSPLKQAEKIVRGQVAVQVHPGYDGIWGANPSPPLSSFKIACSRSGVTITCVAQPSSPVNAIAMRETLTVTAGKVSPGRISVGAGATNGA